MIFLLGILPFLKIFVVTSLWKLLQVAEIDTIEKDTDFEG